MSFWGRLFGSNEETGKIIDTLASGLDKLHYSDQEKAQAHERAQAVFLEWVKNSQGQNLSRRFLTVVITLFWLVLLFGGMVAAIIGVWTSENLQEYKQTYTIINDVAGHIDNLMIVIVAFYFSGPYMSKFSDAAIEKYRGRDGRENASAHRASDSQLNKKPE